ncbi:DUF87 domain-containing protein [Streptomyces sp. NBC_00481]|uniref:helicase HerA domain-containing protein n=2 Tax=unclassified Streptomyces TaxID=2593676 RepID=UPI002DD9850F|nr:DUF87 domain-containing protein [Streptomyces sp. NBC_00481]WRY98104.1 DUF87 domain-containing protein [Streptomyces sp. NBC_00481]
MATVQLDYVPSAVISGQKLWTPAEPLSWGPEPMEPEVSLSSLGESVGAFKTTRQKIESELIDFQNRRLEQILSFMEEASIDLCVFPEYAFLAHSTTLRIFAGFAPKITIVAGLGVVRRGEAAALEQYTADTVPTGANVAAVFSGDACHLVAKKHAAEGEAVVEGEGPRVIDIVRNDKTIRLGVAICKDYLHAGSSLAELDPKPDVVAIPALTGNVAPFYPDAPRDFPRILANHARHGGSTVMASGCKDLFVHQGMPRPIPAGAEGILAVEWHGPAVKPTPIRGERNRVSLRSALVSRSDGDAANIVRAFQALAQSKSSALAPESGEVEQRWLEYLKGKPRLVLISDALEVYRQASNDDLVTPDLARQLARHLLAPETQSVDEHRRLALTSVSQQIQRLIPAYTGDSERFRLLLLADHKYMVESDAEIPASSSAGGEGAEPEARWHFSIGLGRFDSDEAISTLSEQQDMLLTFARSAPPGSRITYRLETEEDPATGNVTARFSVNLFGPGDDASRTYFENLQRIIRSVFLRGWETYTSRYDAADGHRVVISPEPTVPPKIREDHGFLVDVLRATGGGCSLEISGLWNDGTSDDDAGSAGMKVAAVELPGGEGSRWFVTQPTGRVQLGIHVALVTPERNEPLANLVGAALFGGEYKVQEAEGAETTASVRYPVEIAHRILHPPHGRIEGRGVVRRRPLFLPMNDFIGPGEGARIGTARTARPFVDDEREVRIPDASRLLHTYLVGRTGVGKTNTLKNIVRHDLEGQGPVIVVDPHGDLFDYAVRHATFRDPLIALDFTREQVPSLNPIYLDAQDEAEVLENIEDLIEMTMSADYHEWSGPRFADLMRLCLHSLVAVADEENGEWAQIGDVAALVEDREYRAKIVARLRRLRRTSLAERWRLHDRIGEAERSELEQWFASKFGSFRRSSALTRATGGRPDVNLGEMLRRRAAVLVKVPQVGLGKGPSTFLGSFIVKRVLRATMNGMFLGSETPAMLIVDEFQNFVDTSFVTLIPEARKFNLGITVANQTLGQLSTFSLHEGLRNDSLSQTVLGNVGNMIIQGVGRHDAERLAPEVGLTASELSRIGKHRGIVALTVNGERLDPFTVQLSDSRERPGAVAEAVALAQAEQALEQMAAEVAPPRIERVEVSVAELRAGEEPSPPRSRRPQPFGGRFSDFLPEAVEHEGTADGTGETDREPASDAVGAQDTPPASTDGGSHGIGTIVTDVKQPFDIGLSVQPSGDSDDDTMGIV